MTTISLIEHFKKQSKALVKAVKTRDPKAIARVQAVRHEGVLHFGLMKAQHVVAREGGFKSWDELIHASESQLRSALSPAEAVAPSFFVTDLGRSIEWYVRVLGFRVGWQAADHAGVRRGPALIVLVQIGTPTMSEAPAGVRYKSACHLRLTSGVDDYVAQIEAAGQPLTATVKDRPEYGMREAAVRDPDGNDIYIGQQI
jgi:catechol 2,3-dioxygenase-like lactoylglutathione lyase family enzyme